MATTMTFPTITTALHGHTRENPYLVADYPYSFTLRCQMRVWLDVDPKKGTRLARQTTDPKRGNVWNKPKTSTYATVAGGMYLDEQGHVQWYGLTFYADIADVEAFLVHWPELTDAVKPLIVLRLRELRAFAAAHAEGRSGITVNGVPVPLREGEVEADAAKLAAWEALAARFGIKFRTIADTRRELVKAFREGDVATALPIVDRLRTKGLPQCNPPVLPFTYADLLSFVRDGGTEIDVAAWDAFLAEIDTAEAS